MSQEAIITDAPTHTMAQGFTICNNNFTQLFAAALSLLNASNALAVRCTSLEGLTTSQAATLTAHAAAIAALQAVEVPDITAVEAAVAALQTDLAALDADLATHAGRTDNPHGVTAAQVGLGSVPNFPVANQAAAEDPGIANRLMTPERTFQAIEVSVPSAETRAALALKADLVDGKVPAGQLPSYVDDVLEAANLAGFPGTGEAGKIYVAVDTLKTYRWTGSAYAEVSGTPAYATQGQAEAGSENTALMTALRTRQAIVAAPVGTATQTALDAKQSKALLGGWDMVGVLEDGIYTRVRVERADNTEVANRSDVSKVLRPYDITLLAQRHTSITKRRGAVVFGHTVAEQLAGQAKVNLAWNIGDIPSTVGFEFTINGSGWQMVVIDPYAAGSPGDYPGAYYFGYAITPDDFAAYLAGLGINATGYGTYLEINSNTTGSDKNVAVQESASGPGGFSFFSFPVTGPYAYGTDYVAPSGGQFNTTIDVVPAAKNAFPTALWIEGNLATARAVVRFGGVDIHEPFVCDGLLHRIEIPAEYFSSWFNGCGATQVISFNIDESLGSAGIADGSSAQCWLEYNEVPTFLA